MPKEISSPHDHLNPKTCWEKRASLTEQPLYRALAIVALDEPATASGPPAGRAEAPAGDAADPVAAATRAELDRCVAVLEGLKPTQSLEIDAHRISLAVLEKAIKALRGELK